jgi:hypothetical protein
MTNPVIGLDHEAERGGPGLGFPPPFRVWPPGAMVSAGIQYAERFVIIQGAVHFENASIIQPL